MQGEKIHDIVYNLAEPVVESMDMELVAVEFVKEGANWYLRIYIDKEDGVDLDDCQAVSTVLSDLLDEKDPISQAYFLEVSSPGIERILFRGKDFVRFQEALVNVHTYAPINGSKVIKGKLGPVNEENLVLYLEDGEELSVPRNKIAQVRLAWQD